jgi:hypothetical protein
MFKYLKGSYKLILKNFGSLTNMLEPALFFYELFPLDEKTKSIATHKSILFS